MKKLPIDRHIFESETNALLSLVEIQLARIATTLEKIAITKLGVRDMFEETREKKEE